MTTEPRFETYLFFRAEGFYPVQITKESVAANIAHNPGTLKVEACSLSGPNKVIWTQADGWLDAEYAALSGANHATETVLTDRDRMKISQAVHHERLGIMGAIRRTEQAVLQSPEAQRLREGWASVPIYPTDEMVRAMFGQPDETGFYHFHGDFGNIAYQFGRLIDAAMEKQP